MAIIVFILAHLLAAFSLIITENSAMNVSNETLPDPVDFFEEVNGDASLVTWAHGVNSQKDLQEALDGDVMMLEADISVGHLMDKPTGPTIPIMAHPPVDVSDISLEEWLQKVIASKKKKGLKLDFKNIDIVEESLKLLQKHETAISMPLLLNADILVGPVKADDTPVDAERFLSLVTQYYPQSILSVGWTTLVPDTQQPNLKMGYSWDQVIAMERAVRENATRQRITFPIRAAFIDGSRQQIRWLIDAVPKSGITVWSGRGDTVQATHLMNLRSNYSHNLIYYDLPTPLDNDFKRLKSSETAVSDEVPANEKLSPLAWMFDEVCGASAGVEAIAGVEAVAFFGSCLATYMDKYTGTVERPVTIIGVIEFIGHDVMVDNSLAIGLRSNPWLWIKMSKNGSIHHPAEAGYHKDTANLPRGQCYQFEIVDSGGSNPIIVKLWGSQCAEKGYETIGDPVVLSVNVPDTIESTINLALSSAGNEMKVVHSLRIIVPKNGAGVLGAGETLLYSVLIMLFAWLLL